MQAHAVAAAETFLIVNPLRVHGHGSLVIPSTALCTQVHLQSPAIAVQPATFRVICRYAVVAGHGEISWVTVEA